MTLEEAEDTIKDKDAEIVNLQEQLNLAQKVISETDDIIAEVLWYLEKDEPTKLDCDGWTLYKKLQAFHNDVVSHICTVN